MANTYRISTNNGGSYTLLGEVGLTGDAITQAPEDGQEQALDRSLTILRTQGIGPDLSPQEFLKTMPDRVSHYFGLVEEI